MNDRGWIDAVRGSSVLAVAAALRLKTAPARGASGGSVYGCPACGVERRHAARRDHRGALGVRHDGAGFRCMDCDVSGDAIDLVALVLRGKRFPELGSAAKDEVRQWFEQFAGRDLSAEQPGKVAPPPPAEPVNYPPEAEVRTFYELCVSVDCDAGVSAYLKGRNIKPGRVEDFNLGRALPADMADLPWWAGKRDEENSDVRVSWPASGHRLIVPLYDERGLMRSVLARSIAQGAEIKSYAPAGFTRSRLVMACPFGRWLLATGVMPEWWNNERQSLRIVIAEGEIDFLTCATQWSDAAEHAPATLGIVSGSWCDGIAARVPPEVTVVIATDHDDAGEKYAAAIAKSLANSNVTLKRWEPRG
jgi:hypothetical protein